jgi:hypothetical protein
MELVKLILPSIHCVLAVGLQPVFEANCIKVVLS